MLFNHPPIAIETAEPVSPFDDPECLYVALPETMSTFVPPSMQDWRHNPKVGTILSALLDGLKAKPVGVESTVIDLTDYDTDTCELIGQILGEGEISILVDRPKRRLIISESVFAGVWRVKLYHDDVLIQESLETGPYPKILAEWLSVDKPQKSLPETFPNNLMNAPALLYEIFAKSRDFAVGSEEVINLTLLPLTPEDMTYLIDSLGLLGMSILSKGYGDCHIRRTGLPYVWWVQYSNSPGKLILNTLEITLLPSVVMAAPEDLEDSASRLATVLSEWFNETN
jgi:hydrogenase-1 operon protein HyaF